MAFSITGVNVSVPPLFGEEYPDSWFHITENNVALSPREWMLAGEALGEKRSIGQFYEQRYNKLYSQYTAVNNLQKTLAMYQAGDVNGFNFGLPSVSSYVGTLNARAVKQVLGGSAYQRWQDVAEMIANGSGDTRIYGFDLETLGNAQRGKGVFGITEIGINRYRFDGGGVIGKAIGREEGFGSFAVGINRTQKEYLEGLLKRMKEEGLGGFTETEISDLKRASSYSGILKNVFNFDDEAQWAAFDPNKKAQYITVKKLSKPTLLATDIQSGINNLFKVGEMQGPDGNHKNPLELFPSWFANQQQKNAYIYGANTYYDFSVLGNVTRSLMKDDPALKGILSSFEKMQSDSLDVQTILQAGAAAHNMDVSSFVEDVLGMRWSNIKVQQQLRFTGLGGIQAHEAFGDTSNEGGLVHFWAKRLDQVLGEESFINLKDNRIKSLNLSDAIFHIKHGGLDVSEGKQFAIVPDTASKNGRVIPNTSIVNNYYKLDPTRTGVSVIKNSDGTETSQYYATFVNEADMISHKYSVGEDGKIARIPNTRRRRNTRNAEAVVLTADTEDELIESVRRFIEPAEVGAYERNGLRNLGEAGFTEEQIVSAQASKRADYARRTMDRLLSSSGVRTQSKYNTEAQYGHSSLREAVSLTRKLVNEAKKNPGQYDKLFDIQTIDGEQIVTSTKTYSQEAITQLEAGLTKVLTTKNGLDVDSFGNFKTNLVRSRYQIESFLGLSGRLAEELELHRRLEEQLSTAFDVKNPALANELRYTVAYKNLYDYAKELLASQFTIHSTGRQFDVDKYGIDLLKHADISPAGAPDSFYRVSFRNLDDGISSISTLLQNNQIGLQEFANMVGGPESQGTKGYSLVNRNLLTEDQASSLIAHYRKVSYDSGDRGSDIFHIAQEMATAIHGNLHGGIQERYGDMFDGDVPIPRIYKSYSDDILPTHYSTVDENGIEHFYTTSQAVKELYKSGTKIKKTGETFMESLAKRVDVLKQTTYEDIDSSVFEIGSKNMVVNPNGNRILDELLEQIGGTGGREIDSKNMLAQLFSPTGGANGKYSLETYQKRGLQAFILNPGRDPNLLPHQGSSAYIILTNQQHAGKVLELAHDATVQEAASRSYGRLMGTELADHGIVMELQHLHKRSISLQNKDAVIYSVNQGEDFEKILLPKLETYVDKKSGQLKIYFNDPIQGVLSVFRKTGDALPEAALDSRFREGSKFLRRKFNDYLEQQPSFSSYFGVSKDINPTPNDIMHGGEVRLLEGFDQIFRHIVKDGGHEPDARNLNPAQQLVFDFAALIEGKPIETMTPSQRLFNKTMSDSSWQEFFRRRMVTGSITDERFMLGGPNQTNMYFGDALSMDPRYLPQGKFADYNYDRSILGLIRKMVDDDRFSDIIDKDLAKAAFANIPAAKDISKISAIGSESQSENGSYFYLRKFNPDGSISFESLKHGDYANFSGMYDMMRPLYIQQGNPLTFNPDTDIDNAYFNLIRKTVPTGDGTNINVIPVSFGKASIESTEYETRLALMQNNRYNPSSLEHDFIARVKTVSAEMQKETFESGENAIIKTSAAGVAEYSSIISEQIAKGRYLQTGVEVNEETYKEVAKEIASEISNIYQDKSFISPALARQRLFQVNDGYNFNMEWGDVDIQETQRYLKESSERGAIRYGDIIGIRKHDGTRIYHTHADVKFGGEEYEKLIGTIFDEGAPNRVRLEVINGDVADTKIMLFGAEKATANTVNLEAITNILSKANPNASKKDLMEEAFRVSTFIFDKAADGALVLIGPGYSKHGAAVAGEALYNLASTHYTEAGRVKDFVNLINEYEGAKDNPFRDAFDIQGSPDYQTNHRIVGNTSKITGQAPFISWLKSRLENSEDALDRSIIKELGYNEEHGISYATMHRQIMNDHLGGQLLIDRRIEQSIALRGHGSEGKISDIDLQYVKQIRQHARDYNGNYDPSLFGADNLEDSIVRSARNYNSRSFNHERFNYHTKANAIERTISGITESLDYYNGKLSSDYIDTHNIIKLSLTELAEATEQGHRVRSGINVTNEQLMESLFFVDGRPSDYLMEKAARMGIRDASDGYSLYIDLGTKISIGPEGNQREVEGVLVPVANVMHITEGKTLYEEQPKRLASFIRGLVKDSKLDKPAAAMADRYAKFMAANNADTDLLVKDSAMYKVMQQYTSPNSAEFLAQDMAAPLFEGHYQHLKDVVDESRSLELEIIRNGEALRSSDPQTYQDKLRRYNELQKTIKERTKQDAQEIRNLAGRTSYTGKDAYKTLSNLGGRAEVVKDIVKSEKDLAGVVVSVNERGFNRMGLDFGDIANDLITDYELNNHLKIKNYHFEQLEEFIKHGFNDDGIDFAEQVKRLRYQLDDDFFMIARDVLKEYGDLEITDDNIASLFDAGIIPTFDYKNKDKATTELVSDYITQLQAAVKKTPRWDKAKIEGRDALRDLQVEFTTRGINEKIKNKVNDQFRDVLNRSHIAHQYMSQIGTFSEFIRFPVFRSEALVRLVFDENVKDGQVRISNPILNLITNVDFDGDKVFLSALANGTSIMPSTTEAYKNMIHIYDKFLTNDAPLLMAEALESGDAFKYDNPNDFLKQKAMLLEKLGTDGGDVNSFEDAGIKYAKNTGLIDKNITDKGELSKLFAELRNDKGFELGFFHSKEIDEAYNSYVKDIGENQIAQVSAIVARYRKQNIGYISTPAFRLRETIFDVLEAGTLTQDEESLLNNLMRDLTTIDSKSGGLLSLAEQTVIDPKHAKDSMKLSRATKFSKNIYGLMSHIRSETDRAGNRTGKTIAHTQAQNKDYLVNIMEALGGNVMKGIDEKDYGDVVEEFIFNKSHKELAEAIENLKNGTPIVFKGSNLSEETAKNILALNRLYTASTEVFEVSKTYENVIKARSYANIEDIINLYGSELTEAQRKTLFREWGGDVTLNEENIGAWTQRSASKSRFDDNALYYLSGNKSTSYEDILYYYDYEKDSFFKGIKNDDGQYVGFEEAPSVVRRQQLEKAGGNLSYRMLIENPEAQEALRADLGASRFRRILNSITVGEDGGNYSGIAEFANNIDDDNLRGIFNTLIPEPQRVSDDIKQTMAVYDYITSQSGSIDKTAAELLYEMNQQIAESAPRDYAGKTLQPLDKIYADKVKQSLHLDNELFEYYRNFVGSHGDFDFDKYRAHLDFLQENSYDISKTASALTEGYNRVRLQLGTMDEGSFDAKYLTQLLEGQDAKVETVVNKAIQSNNITVLATKQRDILGMFNGDESFMRDFFRWGNETQSSQIVGYGTYMGKSFGRLSQGDIDIIRREGEWLTQHLRLNQEGAVLEGYEKSLKYAIEQTQQALESYTPTSTESAFSQASRIAFYDASGVAEGLNAVSDVAYLNQKHRNEVKTHQKELENLINGINGSRMRQQTVNGSFFEQAKQVASKVTAQQVAAGLAALAGIGFVNKLLHDEHKRSPLEAGHSGAKQPPIINGHDISSGGGAPATPGFGRTVYHDQGSGLNFQVSAKTKQRLSAINGAQGVGLAGGGDTQVYAFNDTKGISDNWLANKFAELAE